MRLEASKHAPRWKPRDKVLFQAAKTRNLSSVTTEIKYAVCHAEPFTTRDVESCPENHATGRFSSSNIYNNTITACMPSNSFLFAQQNKN